MYALFLVGPPGSGKSTYFQNHIPSYFQRFSTDDLVRREAERVNKPIAEVFPTYISSASQIFEAQIRQANEHGLDFVIDQTNLTEKSRKGKLRLISSVAKKIAIYFPAYTPKVLNERIAERHKAGGHTVPEDVVESMFKSYRLPQKTEGFDLCISASHFIDVMKVFDWKK